MSTFAKPATPRGISRPQTARPDKDINELLSSSLSRVYTYIDNSKKECHCRCITEKQINKIIENALVDVFKYVDETVSKVSRNQQYMKEQIEMCDTQIKRKVKKKTTQPLILAQGFQRKSVHDVTESSQNKIVEKDNKMIFVDRVARIET